MTWRTFTLLHRHAPGDPVLLRSDGALDAATLRGRVAYTAAQLPEEGAVVVSCSDTIAFVVAVLAAWRRGLPIALPPNTRARTLDEILDTPDVGTHLGDGDARLSGVLDDDGRPFVLPADRHVATVYTSGSTGPYELVPKSAAQLLGEARVLASAFELDETARVLSTVPPHHIYGFLFGVLVPLSCGGSIVAALPLHASAVEAVAREHRATVLVSTPAHLRGLEMLDAGALPSVKRVFSSGAPLPSATAAAVRQRLDRSVTEIFGSTETGGIAWRMAEGAEDMAWQTLPGIRVAMGEDERLQLWSPFLPADAPRPFATQDRIEPMGSAGTERDVAFRHLGRLDDVVKIGGKRIALGVLEGRLRSLPGVHDAAVLADEAPDGHDRRLRAAIVAPGVDAEALRAALLQWFDPVVIPRRLMIVEALPRESTGKLRRSRLRRLLDGLPVDPDA